MVRNEHAQPPRVTTEAAAAGAVDRSSASAAYRLLWLAVAFDVLAFGVGFGWDRRWHATHPFEDFFSQPHLFAPAVTGALDLHLRTRTP